ncbi:MAG: helix-turn-helix transcriptional regulator [Clostridia bacterium]|nr:helix-turn-helix transcriptional regulator [Clostridia bacterium]
MPKRDPYDYGFGEVWNDSHVQHREGYATSVTDYHRHEFYEINLILSGNVKILLPDRSEEGKGCRVVLTRPGTPHYISCQPDTLYSRLYLVFTPAYVADFLPEWTQLSTLFGEGGNILTVSPQDSQRLRAEIERIQGESHPFRRRLLIYHLLSLLSEHSESADSAAQRIPSYIMEALAYMERHYAERLTALSLAKALHIGRTTLMTEFKRHTGSTVNEYLTGVRLRHAIRLLRDGNTLECTATLCGFSDSSSLVRVFRRQYGTTPRSYIRKILPI